MRFFPGSRRRPIAAAGIALALTGGLAAPAIPATARTTPSAGAQTALPSGRTAYRTLGDYESELARLARRNPGTVRAVTLPHRTLEGRTVRGIDRRAHSVIAGRAPAGATLKISKKFTLWTSPWSKADGGTGAPLPVPTALSSTMVVGPGGRFSWDVNPSVRPQSPFTSTGQSPVTGLVREAWTLTCTPRHGHGKNFKITVDRGQTAEVDLGRCR